MTLQEFRQKYPQYDAISDQILADRLYNKYYSDHMSKDKFYQQINYAPKQEGLNVAADVAKGWGMPKENVPASFAIGVGQGLANLPIDVANLAAKIGIGNRQQPIANYQASSPEAQTIGQFVAPLAVPMGGEEALATKLTDILSRGKGVSSLASFAGKNIARGTTGAASGALLGAQQPEDKNAAMSGALWNILGKGGVEAAAKAIPAIGKGIGSFSSYFSPKEHMNTVMDALSGGKNAEQNAQSLINDLNKSYDAKKKAYDALHDPIKQIMEDEEIDPINYLNLDPKHTNYEDADLKELNDEFLKKPNYENAHNLQSQLGTEFRSLKLKPIRDIAENNLLKSYDRARSALKADIRNTIATKDPELAKQYDAAQYYYATNVAPFKDHPKISRLVSGNVRTAAKANITPQNISNIFKMPVVAEGEVAPIESIVNSLPADAQNRILYSRLAKIKKLKPQSLVDILEPLKTEGFGSYISPSVENSIETLEDKIARKKVLKLIAGGAAAGVAVPAAFHSLASILGGSR